MADPLPPNDPGMFPPASGMPPPPPKKRGIINFGKKEPEPMGPPPGFNHDMLDLMQRLRLLEEQITNMRRRLQMTEKNMTDNDSHLKNDLRSSNSDIEELRHEIQEIRNNLHLAIKELENTVRSEDFKIIKRYLEMWDPSRFVTHDEVLKIIDERLGKE